MKMNAFFIFFLIVVSVNAASANIKKSLRWQIKNTSWTKSIDKSYKEFVAGIGMAKRAGICHTTAACIKNPVANPKYYNLNPAGLQNVYADCADLPYVLKAYFSWMNDLPFTFPIVLTAVLAPGEKNFMDELTSTDVGIGDKKFPWGSGSKKTDIRYNRYGNIIVEKRFIKNGENINKVLTEVADTISTATFRTNASNNTTSKLFRDTYPIAITRDSVKAGTVLYDPNGHVAIVYEVTPNGKVHLIDAHPDNSLTAITYGEKFTQTNVVIGGGFSNWRPFDVDGSVRATANEDLPDYSLEQFNRKKDFIINNVAMNFHEYVRNKLSVGALSYNPILELKESLEEICNDVKERATAVTLGITSGISKKNHPNELPANIYGTDGDWENYSTPSRDARLKASVREGRALMIKMLEGKRNNDPTIIYEGQDLNSDLQVTYTKAVNKCVFDVRKTNGHVESVNLDFVLKNIFKLSFDPYHCVELRWGMLDSESLHSCNTTKENMEWYKAEQGLRNLISRDYAIKMNFSLKELPNSPFGKIPEENISIEDALIN
jgi:hypothetical protein